MNLSDKLTEEMIAYIEHISDLTRDIAISVQIVEQVADRQIEIHTLLHDIDRRVNNGR